MPKLNNSKHIALGSIHPNANPKIPKPPHPKKPKIRNNQSQLLPGQYHFIQAFLIRGQPDFQQILITG